MDYKPETTRSRWRFLDSAPADAVQYSEQVRRLHRAQVLAAKGEIEKADGILVGILGIEPDYLAALLLKGRIDLARGDPFSASGFLSRAASLMPDSGQVAVDLARSLLLSGRHKAADSVLEYIGSSDNSCSGAIVSLRAEVAAQEMMFERAAILFKQCLDLQPGDQLTRYRLAESLISAGEIEAGRSHLLDMAASDCTDIRCYQLLLDTSNGEPSFNRVVLDKTEPRPGQSLEEWHLRVQLAKAAMFAAQGDANRAWETALTARKEGAPKYRAIYAEIRRHQPRLLEMVHGSQTGQQSVESDREDPPISLFIVGPSRSGKSTLETLLGHAPGVEKGYESDIVESAVEDAFMSAGLPTRDNVLSLPDALFPVFQQIYSRRLSERYPSARVVTNTMPKRVEDSFVLARIVPNCRFVYLRRNMYDNGLRIFFKYFSIGHWYAFDIRDTFDYLRFSDQLADASLKFVGDFGMELTYEQLVENPAEVRNMLLDWCCVTRVACPSVVLKDDRKFSVGYVEAINAALKD